MDENRASSFGQGAYFTAEAILSNLYCQQDSDAVRYMFLAEVLVGSFAKGEPSMKRPPYKEDSTSKEERHDSCVDNVDKPTIYVLFDPDQYYPSFLIKYKMKSKVVCWENGMQHYRKTDECNTPISIKVDLGFGHWNTEYNAMLCLSDHQTMAFKDKSTIPKATFIEIGV